MNQAQRIKTDLKYLLAELVQMPTITAEKATTKAALDWIKYQVRDLPVITHDVAHEGYAALVLTTRHTKRPKVMLNAHLDVVPAPATDFKLREENGRYYGRGVFDMKFAVATYLQLLLELGDNLPQYDLGMILTTDEEDAGGAGGAAHLAKAGWGGEVMINPDAIPDWHIQRAAKGLTRYRVTARGEAGHGSRPWAYRSALTALMDYLRDLSAHFPAEPCGDSEHAHATLNIGVITGGLVANQIPAAAEALLDVRIVPGQTVEEMNQLTQKVAAAYPDLTVEPIAGDNPISINPDHPYVRKLQGLITEVTGTRSQLVLSHGGSESGYYMATGSQVLMFGPPAGGHHSDGEWIDKQGVDQFAQIVRKFVEQEARVG